MRVFRSWSVTCVVASCLFTVAAPAFHRANGTFFRTCEVFKSAPYMNFFQKSRLMHARASCYNTRLTPPCLFLRTSVRLSWGPFFYKVPPYALSLKQSFNHFSLDTPKSSVSISSSYVSSVTRVGMALVSGDGNGGAGLHLCPPNAVNTVVFMHGLGDTAHGWAELAEILNKTDKLGSTTRLFLPTADTRPITLNMGMAMPGWSDIIGLHPGAQEDKFGLMESKVRIDKIIDNEIASGIKPERIIIGGFSQGGALAYLVGLTSKYKLGGILGLSCWLPLAKEITIKATTENATPIMHCHGTQDDLVAIHYAEQSIQMIRDMYVQKGVTEDKVKETIVFKSYQGLGHSACPAEFQDIKAFLKQKLEADSM